MAVVLTSVVVLALSIAGVAFRSYVARMSGIDPLPSNWPPTPARQGIFAPNNRLQGLEKVGEGQLPKPEDLAVDPLGRLYTGCADGWVKRVYPDSGKVENWTFVGGHPLGLVWGNNGELLVCEPQLGLLNVTEGKVEVLSNEAEGLKYKLADGLDVAKDGIIYFSDASYKRGMGESDQDVLECRPHGRLLKYDPATRTTTVLLKGLYFANGVALSAEEDFVVVCETAMMRCLKYWLKGEKQGTSDIFIENLPGHPDNIRHNGRNTFWIGLVGNRDVVTDFLFRVPFLKQVMALPAVMKRVATSTKMAKVMAVNEAGQPVAFYEDPTAKSVAFVTTAFQVDDHLYLGGLAFDFIGKLKVDVAQ